MEKSSSRRNTRSFLSRTRHNLTRKLIVVFGLISLVFWLANARTSYSARELVQSHDSHDVHGEEAFVSVLSGVQYLAGCLALGYSLDLHASPDRKRRKVLLVPHHAIDEPAHLNMLSTAGWEVMQVKELALPGDTVE